MIELGKLYVLPGIGTVMITDITHKLGLHAEISMISFLKGKEIDCAYYMTYNLKRIIRLEDTNHV